MYQDFKGFTEQAGYRLAYRPHETNHCPGCGQTQWIVGRTIAECAFCATALPMMEGTALAGFRTPLAA